MKAGVYKLSFNGTDKFYIGSSNDLKRRKGEHRYILKGNRSNNLKLQNTYNKYGGMCFDIIEKVERWDCPVFNIVLLDREQHYIDSLKPELNLCMVAGNTYGRKHTEETKRNMSKRHKENNVSVGERNPMYGKTGDKCPHYGKKYSEERKRNISLGQIGKTINKEALIKQQETKLSKTGLTVEDIKDIRNKYESVKNRPRNGRCDFSVIKLAKEYNVKESVISGIVHYQTWKHIV